MRTTARRVESAPIASSSRSAWPPPPTAGGGSHRTDRGAIGPHACGLKLTPPAAVRRGPCVGEERAAVEAFSLQRGTLHVVRGAQIHLGPPEVREVGAFP